MKNKKFIIVISILLTILSLALITKADVNGLPYPKVGEKNQPHPCYQVVKNKMAEMNIAWNAYMKQLKDQTKPVSELGQEYIESMRTYRCWLDYLCKSVELSGLAAEEDKEVFQGGIETIPGCGPAAQMQIAPEYIPECYVPPQYDKFSQIQIFYQTCRDYVEREFVMLDEGSGSDSEEMNTAMTQSSAYLQMANAIRAASGRQQSRALQEKMATILGKLQMMNSDAQILKANMAKFDNLLECTISKCD